VTLRAGRARIEAGAVVSELENDVLVGLGHPDPDVGRVGVLHRVHHARTRDVEDQQRDRRWEFDLLDVVVEADAGVAADLVRERLEGFGQAGRAEGRSVQFADDRPDAVGGLLLGLLDLLELISEIIELLFVEHLACDVYLEREPEQDLREVVMEIAGDREALVGPLLRHRVR